MSPPLSRERLLDLIAQIRRERGMEESSPVIDEIIDGPHLYIIVEDRPDKSIIIGSSYVAGRLRESLGRSLTILASTDIDEKRRRLLDNIHCLEGSHSRHAPNLVRLLREEMRYPRNEALSFGGAGECVIAYCNNAHAIHISRTLGLRPLLVSLRRSFPDTTKECECWEVEWDPPGCAECRERLAEEACARAHERGADIVFANGEVPLETRDGILLIDPQLLLFRSDFELSRVERCLRMKGTCANARYWTREISGRVSLGLAEPNEGAKALDAVLERCAV